MAIKHGAVSMLEAVRYEDFPTHLFSPKSPRLALVPAAPHRHTYTYPVFTERRFGSLPLLTGYCCACGHVLETGTI